MIYINGSVPCSLEVGDTHPTAMYIDGRLVFQCVTQPKPVPVYSGMYFTIRSLEDNNSIWIIRPQAGDKLSLDGGETWEEMWGGSGSGYILNSGDTMLISSHKTYDSGGAVRTVSKRIEVYGNILSYYYGDDFIGASMPAATNMTGTFNGMKSQIVYADRLYLPTDITDFCFKGLFSGCTQLETAPALPATELGESCYESMFEGCTSLVSAPALPATSLTGIGYCYAYMFKDCTSLATAPALPATTLSGSEYCYAYMFSGCTSLTAAPELPATTLDMYCYAYMFKNCTSLATPPSVISAATLEYRCCYYMFSGCTSLTAAPELPAPVLVGNCYARMFWGCTSLVYVKCLAISGMGDYSGDGTGLWLLRVSPSGTFVKAAGANWPTGDSGIPSGWTVIEE